MAQRDIAERPIEQLPPLLRDVVVDDGLPRALANAADPGDRASLPDVLARILQGRAGFQAEFQAESAHDRLAAYLTRARHDAAAASPLIDRVAPAPRNPLAPLVEQEIRRAAEPGANPLCAAVVMRALPSMPPDLRAAWLAQWLSDPAPPAGTQEQALALIHSGELSDAARLNLMVKLTASTVFPSRPAQQPEVFPL